MKTIHYFMAAYNVSQIIDKYQYILTDEKLQKPKDINLSELGFLVEHINSFIQPTSKKSTGLPRLVELIVSFGLVERFDEDRDYKPEDFPCVADNAEICISYINILISEYEYLNTSGKRKLLVQVLLLCGTHSSNYHWTSEKSVQLSNELIANVLLKSEHKSLSHLLCDDAFHPTIFKGLLRWLRPYLMKDTWFKYPSACYVFYWVLSYVKHPHLVDYMNDICPPAFMFSSYFNVPQQVIGIKCFSHILDNVPLALIKADGTSEAIYHTLKNFRYSKELPIAEVFYPCILKLVGTNQVKEKRSNWSEYDEMLKQLLSNLDYEYNPKLHYAFLNHTLLYIKVFPCFKHLKLLLTVLLRNLSKDIAIDDDCKKLTLVIVQHVIKSCWPRMEGHCFEIILAMLKVIWNIEHSESESNNNNTKEVLSLCEENLFLLKKACPETFVKLVEDYLKEESAVGVKLLKCVLEREN